MQAADLEKDYNSFTVCPRSMGNNKLSRPFPPGTGLLAGSDSPPLPSRRSGTIPARGRTKYKTVKTYKCFQSHSPSLEKKKEKKKRPTVVATLMLIVCLVVEMMQL